MTLPKNKKLRRWVLALGLLATHAAVAHVVYKTARGDTWDTEQLAIRWSQRARAAEEALQVVEDAWTQCILDQHIRFPGDTALRQVWR